MSRCHEEIYHTSGFLFCYCTCDFLLLCTSYSHICHIPAPRPAYDLIVEHASSEMVCSPFLLVSYDHIYKYISTHNCHLTGYFTFICFETSFQLLEMSK
uniref:Uncharacterized protein n=1 Tax=Helianthus annuus TaxID=4232 RepID=A0A251TY28_HELAN